VSETSTIKQRLPTGAPVIGKRRSFGEVPFSNRLRVGVVGLHEGFTALVALQSCLLCRPVAACDLDENKRLAAQKAVPELFVTPTYSELLKREDVDVVAIYTPDPLHADQIEEAFVAGKHVVCTKPLVNDVSVAGRLREAATTHQRRLQVGQSTRFGEPFLRQREAFESGRFGIAEMVVAHYNHRMDWLYEKSPWTLDSTHWVYLGLSHPLDLVQWYLGEIAEVQAMGACSELGLKYGLASEDSIVVNLRSKSGRIGQVFGNFGIHELRRARSLIECFLMGSKGTALARYPELCWTFVDEHGIEVEEDASHAMTGYYSRHELLGMHYGEFGNIFDYFASCLISEKPNSPDLDEGLHLVSVMDSVLRSIQTGQTVTVSEV
jgi:predicted dehydrogenase